MYKVFNGRTYYSAGLIPTKREALKKATEYRKTGARARVVKVRGGYRTYFYSPAFTARTIKTSRR